MWIALAIPISSDFWDNWLVKHDKYHVSDISYVPQLKDVKALFQTVGQAKEKNLATGRYLSRKLMNCLYRNSAFNTNS